MKIKSLWLFAAILAGLCGSTPATASFVTFDIIWSGAYWGNTASAVGFVTLNTSLLPGIGSNNVNIIGTNPYVTALSITVTGARAGNGTFNIADYDQFTFTVPSAGLNLSPGVNLIGQSVGVHVWELLWLRRL